MGTSRKVAAGHRATVFSTRQNRALRSALRALKNSRKLSQLSVGHLLGIAQQNAGRLLKSQGAGFSYDTATKLACELGFTGVDEFFRAKRLTAPSEVASARTGTDG